MNSQKTLSSVTKDLIIVNRPTDAAYWCQHFSVSPFALFHLIKTVGNSAMKIGDFLHKQDQERANADDTPKEDSTIIS
jgi:hypothetical protein